MKSAAQQRLALSMATGETQQLDHSLVGYFREGFFKRWKHKTPGVAPQARCHVTMATNRHTHIEVIDSKLSLTLLITQG